MLISVGRSQSVPTAQRNDLIPVALPKSNSFNVPVIGQFLKN